MSAIHRAQSQWRHPCGAPSSMLAALAFCSAIESTRRASWRWRIAGCGASWAAAVSAARCGWLSVPENREQPAGKQVRLHVAVLPSLRLEPAGDPLFVLSGGPGQAAGDFYISIAPALAAHPARS